jgi:hypothetical protein
MKRFGKCRQIIPLLRRKGVAIEQELARIQAQADRFPEVHSELAAIRYYIRFAILECVSRWATLHSGITNYATLVREIERWRQEFAEKVAFVTFNYDTMLEDSLLQVLNLDLPNFQAYVAHSDYRVFKLHGSTNWGQVIPIEDAHVLNYDQIISQGRLADT